MFAASVDPTPHLERGFRAAIDGGFHHPRMTGPQREYREHQSSREFRAFRESACSNRRLSFLLVASTDRQAVRANVAFSDRRHCAPVRGLANHRPHLRQQLDQSAAVQASGSSSGYSANRSSRFGYSATASTTRLTVSRMPRTVGWQLNIAGSLVMRSNVFISASCDEATLPVRVSSGCTRSHATTSGKSGSPISRLRSSGRTNFFALQARFISCSPYSWLPLDDCAQVFVLAVSEPVRTGHPSGSGLSSGASPDNAPGCHDGPGKPSVSYACPCRTARADDRSVVARTRGFGHQPMVVQGRGEPIKSGREEDGGPIRSDGC